MNPKKNHAYYSENSSTYETKHYDDVFIWSHVVSLSKTVVFDGRSAYPAVECTSAGKVSVAGTPPATASTAVQNSEPGCAVL